MGQDKLIKEAAEAKAAGLSYGKWKALQPEPEPVVVPEGMTACAYCGKLFPTHRNKKYCDSVCNNKDYYRNHPEKKQEHLRRFNERRKQQRLEEKRRKYDQDRTEETTAQLPGPTG